MDMKVKWPFPEGKTIPKLWAFKSKIVVAGVGIFGKVWAEWMNRVNVHNKETLYAAIEHRPANQPLVTITNHHSCLDDPVLWGVLKWRHLVSNNEVMRWTLAASDICFTNECHSWFFSRGRVVPVCRGEGVYQKGMDFMVNKLNSGEWVHTFPEGVGRLISECKKHPLVIPLWHIGMDDILPNRPPYIPRIGKKVTLLVGQPIELNEVLSNLRKNNSSPMEIRKVITDIIQEEFFRLKDQAMELHHSLDR